MREFFVYILSSKSRTLYIGMANDIVSRLHQHRVGVHSFTAKYRIFFLVLLEEYGDPRDAIAREKQLKGWRREKKIWLIERSNPQWIDISSTWGNESIVAICPSDPCGPPERSLFRPLRSVANCPGGGGATDGMIG